MAINLNPGADSTLVRQATRAAMANIPADQSAIHKRISGAYAKEAAARGEMWGKAIKVVGDIGSELIKKAKKNKIKEFNNKNKKFDKGQTTVDFIPGTENEDGMPEIDYDSETTTFTASDGSTFTTTDINGNVKPIDVMTTEEKLRDIRKQLTDLAWFKKNTIDPSTGKPWAKEAKKKEKQRLRNVRDNIRKSNIDFGAFQEVMQTTIAQENINTIASGMYNAEGMLFAQAMLANGDPVEQKDPNLAAYDGASAVQGYDSEGNMIFTYVNKDGVPFQKDGKNMTIAKEDLDSLVVPKSPKRAVFDTLIDDNALIKNRRYGTSRFHNHINKVVKEQVTDKNTFLDLAFYQGDGTSSSLADALNGIEYDADGVASVKETPMFNMLMEAIDNISVEEKNELDVSGDNKLTEKDYNTQENLDKLILKVLSGDNLQLGKNLLEMHYKNAIDTRMDEINAEDRRREALRAGEKTKTTTRTQTTEGGNFAHVNKGQYIPLAGVSVQKGSLENIRTDIENRKPFYLGPKDDEKAFVPVGKSGWEQRDGEDNVLGTYRSLSELIKSGLKTSDKGFRSLITMDIDGDNIPDGPVKLDEGSAFKLNLDFI